MRQTLQFHSMKKILILIGCLLLTLACNYGVPAPTADSPLTAAPQTAPNPGTTTQAIPNAGTVSPSPEPPAPYFSDEFDASSPYWVFMQTGGKLSPTTSFENGALHIAIPSPDTWLIGVHNIHTYSNIFIRARTVLNPGGSTGLICRYSETDGWYEFNVASDGTYGILFGQWLAPGVAKYIPILNDRSSQFAGGVANEIGLHCEDGFLHLYINSILIHHFDASNYGLTEGRVGVTAASFNEVPMTVLFEWVKVSQE